jgi:hypothetical protein
MDRLLSPDGYALDLELRRAAARAEASLARRRSWRRALVGAAAGAAVGCWACGGATLGGVRFAPALFVLLGVSALAAWRVERLADRAHRRLRERLAPAPVALPRPGPPAASPLDREWRHMRSIRRDLTSAAAVTGVFPFAAALGSWHYPGAGIWSTIVLMLLGTAIEENRLSRQIARTFR